MSNPLQNKRILLGITGSIACYKAVDLASKLKQNNVEVTTILTESAQKFITPLSFQSVTGLRAYTDADLWGTEGHILHVNLGQQADLFVIAPISANTIAKISHGIADNLLTITALAARCPLMIAPAMDVGMYSSAVTQENLEILRKRGVFIIGPEEGRMASGLVGLGRMTEPAEILDIIRYRLSRGGILAGHHILVTAGGTVEPIDPVRAITNHSSGKQGFAIAQEALNLGADVTLISGPSHLPTPNGLARINVGSAQEMLEAVVANIEAADAVVMAAAVADFQPDKVLSNKIKKQQGIPEIKLQYTPDILEAISQHRDQTGKPKIIVGFAAESQDLIKNALKKMEAKKLDLVVANDVTAPDSGFSVDTNRVCLVSAQKVEELPLMKKEEVAEIMMDRVVQLLNEK